MDTAVWKALSPRTESAVEIGWFCFKSTVGGEGMFNLSKEIKKWAAELSFDKSLMKEDASELKAYLEISI
ncbi:MAG: hypothetical protein AAF633_19690 [Chloroflexota bacterium]